MIKLEDAVRKLLDNYRDHPDFIGINLRGVNQKGAVDDAPIHIASRKGHIDNIKLLIEYGAKVNQQGDLGFTPLHYGAMVNNFDVITVLLANGADKTIKNEFGQTALDVAKLNHTQNTKVIGILS